MKKQKNPDLPPEADVAGMVRIRRSNLVTSARAWFSSSSHIISVTSWIFDACFLKSTEKTNFNLHLNPSKSTMILCSSKVKIASVGKIFHKCEKVSDETIQQI